MASVSELAASAADDSSVGTVTWSNTSFALTEDGSCASINDPMIATSHYLKWTDFGFSITAGSTIDGIIVRIKKTSPNNGMSSAKDNRVRIVKGGTIGSTDKSLAGNWASTLTNYSHGNSADLWGDSWGPTDINSSGFGVAISANTMDMMLSGQIDVAEITVHFTEAVDPVVHRGMIALLQLVPAFLAPPEVVAYFRRWLRWLFPPPPHLRQRSQTRSARLIHQPAA